MKLTYSEFLRFLTRHCAEHVTEGAHILNEERGRNDAYQDVSGLIKIFLSDYAEQKKLTQAQEKAFLEAIEVDRRKAFDTPDELIRHIWRLASDPAFDTERVALAAIHGFTSDYILTHDKEKNNVVRTA